MYVIIAGCGRVGAALANSLSYERHDVVVIDRDASAFNRLGSAFNGITLEGMAFDEDLLVEAGIEQADIFASVTSQDNTNLMASQVATSIYGVPKVISRLYDPARELTYFKMGLDYVCGTTLMTDRIRERLFQGEHIAVQQDRLDLGLQVVEFRVGESAGGRAAGELNYGVSSHLLTLLRDNKELAWSENTPLEPGDLLMVTLRRDGWRAIKDCLGEDSVAGHMCPADLMPVEELGDSLYHRKPENSKVIVGGCSMVGAHLGYLLSMDGYEVTIIDEDPSKFKRLPRQYAGRTLEGVIYDGETLLEAGIEEASAFAAVTKFDNKNLMAAEVVRYVFDIHYVLGRLFNPDKEGTYQALGMPYVCGTRLVAQGILERILKPLVAVRTSCCFNRFDLVEFNCPRSWDGKTVRRIREASGLSLAYVTRRSTGYLPEDNFVLRAGDSIAALSTEKRRQRLEKVLYKDQRGESNSHRD
ncbi:MAG TPA: NAD-binding protein [Candidatus Anoxymicrobiaceae bacterium]